ncbi:MAG: sodium-dependent bicarbonate transport family permease [Chthonomonas sp.]|nr:sodium-dependent bicarbonate transport family permease [Chthonomonas sp.]
MVRQSSKLRFGRDKDDASPFLLIFGTLVPLVNGALGTAAGVFAGLSAGGAGVLGSMAASASYIAAPAAVRLFYISLVRSAKPFRSTS